MLMVYLPRERLIVEADLVDTHLPLAPTAAGRALINQVRALRLDVAQVVPIHGQPMAWADVVKAVAPK
jgi:hypothetical protein